MRKFDTSDDGFNREEELDLQHNITRSRDRLYRVQQEYQKRKLDYICRANLCYFGTILILILLSIIIASFTIYDTYLFPVILFGFAFAILIPTLALSVFIDEETKKEYYKERAYPLVTFFVVFAFSYLLFFRWTSPLASLFVLWFFIFLFSFGSCMFTPSIRKRVKENEKNKVRNEKLFDEVTAIGSNPNRKQRVIFT